MFLTISKKEEESDWGLGLGGLGGGNNAREKLISNLTQKCEITEKKVSCLVSTSVNHPSARATEAQSVSGKSMCLSPEFQET